MGLITNIHRFSGIPLTSFGGVLYAPELNNFRTSELWVCTFAGEGGFTNQTSLPDGDYPPNTWRLPLVAGAIKSLNRLNGSGSLTALGNLGYQIIASLTGSGTISSALGTLTVELLASISGNGTISDADLRGYLYAVASLYGSGDITDADINGIGELISALDGSGVITSSLTGVGELAAVITSYGSLTAEGVRDAVWNALATQFNAPGTMGNKLNSAASAGDPWTTALPGTYPVGSAGYIIGNLQTAINAIPEDVADTVLESGVTVRDALRLMLSVMVGKTDIVDLGGGAATVTFRDINDTKNRVVADMTGSERTNVTNDPT